MTNLTPSEDIRKIITLLEAQPPMPRTPPSRGELEKKRLEQAIRRKDFPYWFKYLRISTIGTLECFIPQEAFEANIFHDGKPLVRGVLIEFHKLNNVRIAGVDYYHTFKADIAYLIVEYIKKDFRGIYNQTDFENQIYNSKTDIDNILSQILTSKVSGSDTGDWFDPLEKIEILSREFYNKINEQLEFWKPFLLSVPLIKLPSMIASIL